MTTPSHSRCDSVSEDYLVSHRTSVATSISINTPPPERDTECCPTPAPEEDGRAPAWADPAWAVCRSALVPAHKASDLQRVYSCKPGGVWKTCSLMCEPAARLALSDGTVTCFVFEPASVCGPEHRSWWGTGMLIRCFAALCDSMGAHRPLAVVANVGAGRRSVRVFCCSVPCTPGGHTTEQALLSTPWRIVAGPRVRLGAHATPHVQHWTGDACAFQQGQALPSPRCPMATGLQSGATAVERLAKLLRVPQPPVALPTPEPVSVRRNDPYACAVLPPPPPYAGCAPHYVAPAAYPA